MSKARLVFARQGDNSRDCSENEPRLAIVCVDDEQVILSSLGEQLKRSLGNECDIELVDNGREAIALCAELVDEGMEIPVIISDQIMPVMTGDRLLIELHSLYPDTLKILLTGQANADAVGNLVNAAALYRYVAKPWQETDLILTVKEALKRYRQERQLAEQNEMLLQVNQQLASTIAILQATLEATADGILVLDGSGKAIKYNQKFLNIWGLSPTDKLDREQILTLLIDKLNEPYTSNLNERYLPFAKEQYNTLYLNNGKILECYLQIQQLQEQTVGQVWSFRDVTEHKKTQLQIQHQAFHDSLTDLPNRTFNTIKIDRSFVKDLTIDSSNLAIVNAITTLGRELNLQIVAEGVESEQLKNLLETLHCNYMQGYFISKPLPVTDATKLLMRSRDRDLLAKPK